MKQDADFKWDYRKFNRQLSVSMQILRKNEFSYLTESALFP